MPEICKARTAIRLVLIVVMLVIATATSGVALAQEPGNKARLWKDPAPVASRDLFWGSGSAERAPKGPFTFVQDDTSGTQPKIRVRDASGREWDVKFGQEVHAEIAANRLVWATGYVAEEMYFVADGTVTGFNGSGRAREHVAQDGAFTKARFRLRTDAAERAEQRWTFEENPFVKTQELSGLAILMTMLNNWDIQADRNNRILLVEGEAHYIVSDLGATFGKMGAGIIPHSKWNLEHFQKEEFIDKVEDGMLDLDYEGWGGINKVPLEHARWFSAIVSQLTDDQLQAALKASGAAEPEVAGFAARLRQKITELQNATK